jgi:hypothetical protein
MRSDLVNARPGQSEKAPTAIIFKHGRAAVPYETFRPLGHSPRGQREQDALFWAAIVGTQRTPPTPHCPRSLLEGNRLPFSASPTVSAAKGGINGGISTARFLRSLFVEGICRTCPWKQIAVGLESIPGCAFRQRSLTRMGSRGDTVSSREQINGEVPPECAAFSRYLSAFCRK